MMSVDGKAKYHIKQLQNVWNILEVPIKNDQYQ